MHVLLQGILIPQLTQILNSPATVPSQAPFIIDIQLFDQFGPVNYKNPEISIFFSVEKNTKGKKSAIEFQLKINEGEITSLEIIPFSFGKYWIHIEINHCEISDNAFIEIIPSQEELENSKVNEDLKLKEKEKEREKIERMEKIDTERKKGIDAQEEANRKKKEETEKRAQEALKSHREKQEKEKEKEDRERKQRLELKTGGGYDLKKKKGK